jgi:hypothetical protein
VSRVQHQILKSPNYIPVRLCLYGKEQSAMLYSSGSKHSVPRGGYPVRRFLGMLESAQWKAAACRDEVDATHKSQLKKHDV